MRPRLENFVICRSVFQRDANIASVCESGLNSVGLHVPKDASSSSVPQIWAKTSTIARSDFKSHIHCSCATP